MPRDAHSRQLARDSVRDPIRPQYKEPEMSRIATSLISLTTLAGCASKPTQDLARVGEDPREALSYAATAKYPHNAQLSDEVQAVAIVHPDGNFFEIHDLSNNSIGSSTLWVNGASLQRLDDIPPKSSSTVRYVDLLEAGPGGSDFGKIDRPVHRVELQTRGGLFKVLGSIEVTEPVLHSARAVEPPRRHARAACG
jgi:hypothetical protein